jgi:class 3 adenylate cyclase/TolB-like protein/Flp pilus assembly protein TadD
MPPVAAGIRHHFATVLAADAVGFSRRMREDAKAAVSALLDCRAIMTEVVDAFHGSTVGTPGDFFLALMPNGLEAVEAAVEIQRRLAARNRVVEEPMQSRYRIGIGIGDIYENGSDVLGDAVNVASRLQAIAEPGGIVASAAVRDAAGAPVALRFDDLGELELKGIAGSVRVYAVLGAEERKEKAGEAAVAAERLPIKPVIEIEIFRTLDDSQEGRMFADGLVDEMLAMLASLSNSLVVRQILPSQAQPPAAGAVRRYRLGGSVRRSSEGVRIISRLTDCSNGEALWADRFDYKIDQSFDVHELIAREVVTALQVKLTEGEQAHLWSGGTTNVRAWELFQRGHDLERRFSRDDHKEARRCYAEALRHDGSYLSAVVALAFCHLDEIRLGWAQDDERSFSEAKELYRRAVALNADDAQCHALRAYIELHDRNDAAAVAAMEAAVRLAPRSSELVAYLGTIYDTVGRYEEAIVAYRRGMWLSQHFPPWIATNLGLTLCVTRRAEEARKLLSGVIVHYPEYSRAHLCLALALAQLDRLDEARRAARELLRLDPLFTIAEWARNRPYTDPKVMDDLMAAMRVMGLT